MSDPDSQVGNIHSLFKGVECELYTDPAHTGIYATDASIYQVNPMAVALPRNRQDVIELVAIAYKNKIPILGRGGGTSLAGQTVGKCLVIDFSKYCNKILAYNPGEQWVEVQPGIILDQLNEEIRKDGLIFSPDPATSSRATIGGMIANNSSGTKSIQFGKTIDHVVSLDVLLADGSQMTLEEICLEDVDAKCKGDSRESGIFKKFREIIFSRSDEIIRRFPKTLRRVSGYPLDEFSGKSSWNMAKLFCGSEGTLGIVLSAKLHLDRLPKHKAICLVHFDDRLQAIRSVKNIVESGPTAVELLDKDILDRAKENLVTRKYYESCVLGDPDTILITEFFGENHEEIILKTRKLQKILDNCPGLTAAPVYTEPDKMQDIWDLRKQGLGLALSSYDVPKPLPFVEDSAIPLEHLAPYIEEVSQYCESLGVEMVIYAHASVGVLHVRPYLNLRVQKDIDIFMSISNKCFELVRKYNGSWSGEHGDGLVRSYKLQEFFGDEIYDALRQVKTLFDPDHLMNPGKIVDPEPPDQNFRYGTGYQDQKINGVFKYRKENSFEQIVHNCSGVGACRKISGGTMCPSYQVTLDELHTTRGRANTLRLAMSGQLYEGDLSHPDVLAALDLCLSCKACKTECPTQVDMAKLKSEILQINYRKKGPDLREKLIDQSIDLSKRFSGNFASMINAFNKSLPGRQVLSLLAGFSPKRRLPEYASQTFNSWYKQNYSSPKNATTQVYLFCDTYTNYHDPHIGKAAVNLLAECGYHAELLDVGCCQRPRISNGFLEKAKREGVRLAENMGSALNKNIPILVLEPGCASALQEDLPDLLDDEKIAKQLQNQIKLIDVFLSEEQSKGNLKGQFLSSTKEILFHGHCHQKALYGTSGMHQIFKSVEGLMFREVDSGCCGMAGSFGYEKEHYKLSEKIANRVLIPAIKALSPDATIVANGFSCRHQIEHFSGRKTKHFVELTGYLGEVKENETDIHNS